jgi:hypothetical protein
VSRRWQGFGRCGAVRSDATPTRQKLLSSGENLDLPPAKRISASSDSRTETSSSTMNTTSVTRNRRSSLPGWRRAMPCPRSITRARYAEAGGLMSYGISLTEAYRQMGLYTSIHPEGQ